MKYRILTLTLMTFLLIGLSGCGRISMQREIVWAKMGTMGRVVAAKDVELLVEQDGELVPAKADIVGMMVIDQITLEKLLE